MAVSKRLRFEILRRDNHTCRYCGAAAPDVPLRIDHVTPVALGGTDTADNLVTSCEPCNNGKTSTSPDATHVAQVADDAVRWAAAMKQAADNMAAAEAPKVEYREAFLAEWNRWGRGSGDNRKPVELPGDWAATLERFRLAGLPSFVWKEIVDTAMGYDKVKDVFKYCCGIAWNKVHAMHDDARKIFAAEDGKPQERAESDAEKLYPLIAAHLHMTWAWAWERTDGPPLTLADRENFYDDIAEMLVRGLSGELDLTEYAYLAGTDHACDPSSYLPDEYLTPAQIAARKPLTDEEFERGRGVLNVWAAAWERKSPDGSPSAQDEFVFLANLADALRAGHERDWLLDAASLAGGFLNTDIGYYLPKPYTPGDGA